MRPQRDPCPICGFHTIVDYYDICPVCFWEAGFLPENPYEPSGCNGVSLYEARRNYKRFRACIEDMKKFVRKPRWYEYPQEQYPPMLPPMWELLNSIAQRSKKARFNAVTGALRSINVPYTVQELPYPNALGNIIVQINPEKPVKRTVISAHYDNYENSPGANNSAAACVILLHLIQRCMEVKTEEKLEFVFFDFGENGCRGSQYYLEHLNHTPACVYNLDMIGMGDRTVAACWNGARNMIAAHLDGIHQFSNLPDKLNKIYEVSDLPRNDAHTFGDAGIPTVCILRATEHDVKQLNNYARTGHVTERPDFLQTRHKWNDLPEYCSIEDMETVFVWLMECLGLRSKHLFDIGPD